jgi:hypothetical protein
VSVFLLPQYDIRAVRCLSSLPSDVWPEQCFAQDFLRVDSAVSCKVDSMLGWNSLHWNLSYDPDEVSHSVLKSIPEMISDYFQFGQVFHEQ